MNKEKKTKASIDNIYTLNGKVPLGHAVPFGLQHILAMFVANIAPIIIVANACKLSNGQIAMLIQSAMLIAGIGTLIQLFPIWRVGSGLPIVMGISFTFVSILCFIGTTYGYETIVGAVLIGGILEGTLLILPNNCGISKVEYTLFCCKKEISAFISFSVAAFPILIKSAFSEALKH